MRSRRRQEQPVRQPRMDADEQSYAFRRSRTITGSTTDNVRAAGENRAQLKSPRLHEHSLRKHRRKLLAYLLLILTAWWRALVRDHQLHRLNRFVEYYVYAAYQASLG